APAAGLLDGVHLVLEDGLRVVEEAADERALAVVDAASRGEAQQVHVEVAARGGVVEVEGGQGAVGVRGISHRGEIGKQKGPALGAGSKGCGGARDGLARGSLY